MNMRRLMCLAAAAVFLAAMAGCSAKRYTEWADREVYKILENKQIAAFGEAEPFTIEPSEEDPLAGLPHEAQPLVLEEPVSAEPPAQEEEPPAILSLNKAIEIAIRHSRDYQSRKEQVYLSALSLTGERHEWSPRFSALLGGRWTHDDGDEYWTADSAIGVRQLLSTGGQFTANLTTDLLRFATGDPRESAASFLSATLIQPLWRGAGRRVAQENLRQAERDVIYEVRSFARYHRTFAVQIAVSYFQILEQRDVVRNEWNNYQRLVLARERAENLSEAGRLPEFQVDQARQDELSARDRYVRAQQSYREALDEFKIDLGLPTDANVDVDEKELAALTQAGIIHPAIPVNAAVQLALQMRLDLLNALDSVDDAARKVYVAENGLAPDVDLVLTAGVPSDDRNRPAELRFERGRYSGGLDIELPLDRKLERNALRRTQIAYNRTVRDAEQLTDEVKLQVRQSWRRLQQARESYEIQKNSLALAERRVESTSLLLQAGRADTRDLLEAQSALLNAQNALIGALVDHTIARLQLWRDMEMLVVTPSGELEEQNQNADAI